ncbi:MAG: hypothetical protein CME07_05640 [Gemmatimonadetes bacterium]|jgi:hypothetical protein|nr:hypothetical protein [Gemmatimonadota bacterium]
MPAANDSAPQPEGPTARTHLIRTARILVSAGLLAWVLTQADLNGLRDALGNVRVEWLLAAFAVNTAGNLLGAWRWQILLRSQGRNIPIPTLFGSYMVGLFFNNFLPSSIGGDVVRAADARREGGGTLTESLTVILVERLIGLIATLSLGGIAVVAGATARLDPRITAALALAMVIAGGGLHFALDNRFRRLAERIAPKLPVAFVRETVSKMLAAFELFSRARRALLANFAISLGFQLLLIVHFWLIQFALGEDLPFMTYLATVPLVFCVMMLPVGINGIGVREKAFVTLLAFGGMAPEKALALSLLSYGIAVGQGLLGGLVHLKRELAGRRA